MQSNALEFQAGKRQPAQGFLLSRGLRMDDNSLLEAEINDLLRFVFSEPQTPGKKQIQKALKKDWRDVIRAQFTLTEGQAKAIDSLAQAGVDAIRKVADATSRKKIPTVRITFKPDSDHQVQQDQVQQDQVQQDQVQRFGFSGCNGGGCRFWID